MIIEEYERFHQNEPQAICKDCQRLSDDISDILYKWRESTDHDTLAHKRACELNKSHIISTHEDTGLRFESFAAINLRGVSTNNSIILYKLEPKVNGLWNVLMRTLVFFNNLK